MIAGDTVPCMDLTLHLTIDDAEALRQRAAQEETSMQDVARRAIRSYIEEHERRDALAGVLDAELPRYSEAIGRLGH